MSQPALQHFLVAWRQELREELKTNSQGHLRSKQPSLARTIPNNFPNLTALSLYSCPTTSWSEGFFLPITDGWIVKLPSLPELSLYCKRKFGWSAVDMVDRFKRLIFPSMFAKRITLVCQLTVWLRILNNQIAFRHQHAALRACRPWTSTGRASTSVGIFEHCLL
jgi:hypothetical protein